MYQNLYIPFLFYYRRISWYDEMFCTLWTIYVSMMLKYMLMELNDRGEVYEININISKTKTMVIGRKPKKIDM